MAKRGKFIVLDGKNMLGKSEQAERLVDRLTRSGIRVAHPLKFPVTNLMPTGPIIDSVLRRGEKMSPYNLQKLFAQNRRDYEPYLKEILANGIWVVAENYVLAGIVWGVTEGVYKGDLEEQNVGLMEPDIKILLHGNSFPTSRERNHIFENSDKKLAIAGENFLIFGQEQGYHIVDANQARETVAEHLWDVVRGESKKNKWLKD